MYVFRIYEENHIRRIEQVQCDCEILVHEYCYRYSEVVMDKSGRELICLSLLCILDSILHVTVVGSK